ncbi:MAG TPA: thioredoxin-disulfide reductase, partial [Firmicutes bacterium]|nr:thioredoxin-disulfide reductase [Bacillota bacterium]
KHFLVKTKYSEYEGKSIIIATGCKHRKLGLENEDKLIGHGISYCAVCDGAFYKGKDVILIGDANTALQYAISLSSICNKVTIATLFDKFFADQILIDKLKELKNVTIFHNLSSKKLIGESELKAIEFVNTKTNEIITIPADGAFIAIGQVPDNEKFANLADLENGFILVDENKQTKTKGVFAVGDCIKKKVRQVITAASDGAIASLSSVRYIDSLS